MRLMGFRDVDYKKMVAAGITTDQIKNWPVIVYVYRFLKQYLKNS